MEFDGIAARGSMSGKLSLLDSIRLADQYRRLEIIQQNLAQVQDKQIQGLVTISEEFAGHGDLKTATEISECAVLCAIAKDEPMLLARTLTIHAKILFAAHEYKTAINNSLQALNCVRRKTEELPKIRAFFVEQEFEFGVALVDQKIAGGLEPSVALNLLNDVRIIFENHDYRLGLGYVLWSLGDIHKDARHLEAALTCYLRAAAILRGFQMHIAELLISLSFVYSQLNQLEEAERHLNQAGQIFSDEQNELGMAGININRAAFMRRTVQYRTLVRLYRQAYEIYQNHGQASDVAFVQMQIATLLTYYPGHQGQAMALLNSAIATFDKINNKRLASKARGYMAALYFYSDARNQARELLIPIVNEVDGEVSAETLWQALYILGETELSEGNLVKAYEYYGKAMQIIDSMRAHLRTEELILDFLNLKPDFYSPLAMLAKELDQPLEALSWVEQARSRSFLHILGNARSTFRSDLDAILLEELNEAEIHIAVLEKTLASRQSLESPNIVGKWRENLNKQLILRENLNRKRKIHNAEVADLDNVLPIDWLEIRNALSA